MAPVPRSSIEGVIWIWTATWGKVYCAPHLFPFGGMLPWKRQLKLKIGSSLCNVCNEHHMEHETWMPCLKAAAKQMWGDWYIHDAAASAWAEIHTQSSSYVQWICNHTCEMNIFSISWQIYLWHIYDTLLTFFSFCFYPCYLLMSTNHNWIDDHKKKTKNVSCDLARGHFLWHILLLHCSV